MNHATSHGPHFGFGHRLTAAASCLLAFYAAVVEPLILDPSPFAFAAAGPANAVPASCEEDDDDDLSTPQLTLSLARRFNRRRPASPGRFADSGPTRPGLILLRWARRFGTLRDGPPACPLALQAGIPLRC